ncbi:beta-1,3-galactosyltransferase 1-like [Ptychodera flava]|uniref:beta-1,3-galactosyltransferase 1-like n=1 Tax=Ptychodera flava TaxID=63121 RepID=UPI00396AA8E5
MILCLAAVYRIRLLATQTTHPEQIMAIKDKLFVRLLLLSLLPLLNLCLYLYFMRPSKEISQVNDGGKRKLTDFSRQVIALLGNNSAHNVTLHDLTSSEDITSCNNSTSCLSGYMRHDGVSRDMKFLLSNPYRCDDVWKAASDSPDLFLLVLVSSRIVNFVRREAIRQTWGSVQVIGRTRIITMFLIGSSLDDRVRKLVRTEKAEYDDIIMGDFIDSYYNLTVKSIMGFKWVKYYCPRAKFILKADDDMYLNYAAIVDFLPKANSSHYAAGYVYLGQTPNRNSSHKWFMSRQLYQSDIYPPFCSGTGYVMSSDVVRDTYEISLDTPLLPLEDVYVGVCWDKLHISPLHHPGFRVSKQQYPPCMYYFLLTVHDLTPDELYEIWNFVKKGHFIRCNHLLGIKESLSPAIADFSRIFT